MQKNSMKLFFLALLWAVTFGPFVVNANSTTVAISNVSHLRVGADKELVRQLHYEFPSKEVFVQKKASDEKSKEEGFLLTASLLEKRRMKRRFMPQTVVDIRTVSQGGHTIGITDLAYSPNGKYLASAGRDETIRIWEIATGLQVKRYLIGAGSFAYVKFLDNEHIYQYQSDDSHKHIINIFTDEKFRIPDHIELELFSDENDPSLAYGFSRIKYNEWDYKTIDVVTKKIKVQAIPETECQGWKHYFSDFSSEKKLAVFACAPKSVEIWDMGRMAMIFRMPVKTDRKLASYKPLRAYLVPQSDLLIRILKFKNGSSEMAVIGYKTGDVLNKQTFSGVVSEVAFSPVDPNTVYLSLGNSNVDFMPFSVVKVNIKNNKTFFFKTENYGTEGFALSGNGASLAVNDQEHKIRIFETASQKEIKRLGESISNCRSMSLSPKDNTLATGSEKGELLIWDLFNLSLDKVVGLLGANERFKTVAHSKDGKSVFTSSRIRQDDGDRTSNVLRLWDVHSGELVRSNQSRLNAFDPVTIHPNEKHLFVPFYQGFSYLDRNSWEHVASFEHKNLQSVLPVGQHGVVGHWAEKKYGSKGELILLSGDEFKTHTVLDQVTTGRTEAILSVALDKKRVLALFEKQFHVYDVSRNSKIQQFDQEKITKCFPNKLFPSEDGKLVVLDNENHSMCAKLVIVDIENETVLAKTEAEEQIHAIAFFNENRHLVYSDNSGAIVVWNIEDDQKVRMVTNGKDWVIYTSDGFFTASRNGGKLVAGVTNMHGYRIDQIAIRNNRPDIIFKRMKLGTQELIDAFHELYLKRIRQYGIDEDQLIYVFGASPKIKIHNRKKEGRKINLTFGIEDKHSKILSYNIYVNDVPLFGMHGRRFQSTLVTESVMLGAGINKIEISAINELGIESLRESFTERYDKQIKGDLYFVGFGVSKYAKPELSLKYAAKDAVDLGNQFKAGKEAFKQIHVTTFIDEKVSKEAFEKAAAFLSSSTIDDTVIVFVAGHGMYDTKGPLEYFFLLSSSDTSNLRSTAINYTVIENLLQHIQSREKMLLLDTCQSGVLEEADIATLSEQAKIMGVQSRGIKRNFNRRNVKRLRKLLSSQSKRYIYNDLFRRTGAIVFSSSRGNEFSYESDAFKNGNFTEAILKSLTTNEADQNNDQKVSTNEMREFVSEAVAESTGGLQHPVVDRDNLFVSWEFPISVNKPGVPGAQ